MLSVAAYKFIRVVPVGIEVQMVVDSREDSRGESLQTKLAEIFK